MSFQECNLNVRYDLPKEILAKLGEVYSKMPGWLGFGTIDKGYNGIPIGLVLMKVKNILLLL